MNYTKFERKNYKLKFLMVSLYIVDIYYFAKRNLTGNCYRYSWTDILHFQGKKYFFSNIIFYYLHHYYNFVLVHNQRIGITFSYAMLLIYQIYIHFNNFLVRDISTIDSLSNINYGYKCFTS